MRSLRTPLVLLCLTVATPLFAADRPADENIGTFLNQLGIPKDPALVRRVLKLSDSSKETCDPSRQSPDFTNLPIWNTCNLALDKLVPKVSDSAVQIFTPTRGTVLIGSGVKLCIKPDDKTADFCFYTTNRHVTEGEKYVGMVKPDGTTVEFVKVIASKPEKDLTLLEAPAGDARPGLKPAALPQVGDSVFTVGHPYGFPKRVVTAGSVFAQKVSARAFYPETNQNRLMEDMFASDFITLDGNSGGGVFDKNGDVAGINVISFDPTAQLPRGGSTAIPVDEVVALAKDYLKSLPKSAQTQAPAPRSELLEPMQKGLYLAMGADKAKFALRYGITDKVSPGSPCDRRPQSPWLTGQPVQDTCGFELSKVYLQVKDAVTQAVVPQPDTTINWGSAFKYCKNNKCVYITNDHVRQDANEVGLVSQDGQNVVYAKVLATDPVADITLVEVPPGDTRPSVVVGAHPKARDVTFAVGHPFGIPGDVISPGYVLDPNQSVGIIGGSFMTGLIQSDGFASGGNSGGPDFNTKGEVIGVKSSAGGGTSMSIPIQRALDMFDKLP